MPRRLNPRRRPPALVSRSRPVWSFDAAPEGAASRVRPAWAPTQGCKSPVDQMAETTSQWQLRRREAGWEGSRRRDRDPRNTNRIGGQPAWASQHAMTKPVPSRSWGVNAAGARRRLVPLSGEICRDVGLDERRPTPPANRRPVTRQKSAEAVVVARSCATKGQTQSRGPRRGARADRKESSQPLGPRAAGPRRNGRYG